jgi:O-antigen ligase
MVFRNSWFPGAHSLVTKEPYIIICITGLTALLAFEFEIINHRFILFERYNFFLVSSLLLIAISILMFNIQELQKVYSLTRLFSFLCYFFLYAVIMPKYILSNEFFLKRFIQFFMYLGFILGVLGFLFLIAGFYPIPKYSFALLSIIEHPNYIPPIFVMSFFASLYYFITYKTAISFYEKLFTLGIAFVTFLANLFTFSRNGILAIVIGLIVFTVFYFRSKSIYVLPIISIFVPTTLFAFFKAKGFESLLSRFYLLLPAYYMLKESRQKLLWGYGFTGALKQYEEYKEIYNVLEADINNPHNSFVSIILMSGLIFFIFLSILFALLLISLAIKAWKCKQVKEYYFYIFVISVIVSFIGLGIFESSNTMVEFFGLQVIFIFCGIGINSLRGKNYLFAVE